MRTIQLPSFFVAIELKFTAVRSMQPLWEAWQAEGEFASGAKSFAVESIQPTVIKTHAPAACGRVL